MRLMPLVAMLCLASASAAQTVSDAERVKCVGAVANWAPVKLPEAGINALIPCNDSELSAYKNANEERKRTEGIAGCERAGRTYLVMYLVNTPQNFFEQFSRPLGASPSNNFEVSGHRVSRSTAVKEGKPAGQQLIEIDASRSVLMWSSSQIASDKEYPRTTSCFFNSFEFPRR